MSDRRFIFLTVAVFTAILLCGCDGGLAPLEEEEIAPYGAIEGTIHYVGEWPPEDELIDLRFIPLTFIPQNILDFATRFESIRFTETLDFNAINDGFLLTDLENGMYVYNVIAQRYGNELEWKPVWLYEENNGVIVVEGDTVKITITVDFDNPPPFSPE